MTHEAALPARMLVRQHPVAYPHRPPLQYLSCTFIFSMFEHAGSSACKRRLDAIGTRGMFKLQNYGNQAPTYHGNAYTIASWAAEDVRHPPDRLRLT